MTLLLPRSPAAGRALTWRGGSQGTVPSPALGPLAAVRHLFRDHSTGDSHEFGDKWPEPRAVNGHRYHPLHQRKGSDLASDWRTLYLASKLAHWSGLTYLPPDSPLAAALEAQGLQLVAAGRTAFTSWFVADGVVDLTTLRHRAGPQAGSPAARPRHQHRQQQPQGKEEPQQQHEQLGERDHPEGPTGGRAADGGVASSGSASSSLMEPSVGGQGGSGGGRTDRVGVVEGGGGGDHTNGHANCHATGNHHPHHHDQSSAPPHEGAPVRLHLTPHHQHPQLHLHRPPGAGGGGGRSSNQFGGGGGGGKVNHPTAPKEPPSDKARHVSGEGAGQRALPLGGLKEEEDDVHSEVHELPAGSTSPLVPGTRCRFIFLRGVHWAAPEINTLSLSASLASFWPTPLLLSSSTPAAQEPASPTIQPSPGPSPTSSRPRPPDPGAHLVAHSGVAALARELMPVLVPHIRDAASSGAQHLVFAGHSLGGSLGKLLWAMSLLGGHSSPTASSCHTFGSLPVLAHASGGGGARVLRALGAPPAAALNWVLEHDPVPRALLTTDPTLAAARAALPGLDALLALRGAVLGEGAPLSSGRFLYESVGELMLVRWCAKGGCEVVPVSEAETEAVLRLDPQQAVTAPVRTLQHWLDHHHASYHHDLEAAALATYRRQARARKEHR